MAAAAIELHFGAEQDLQEAARWYAEQRPALVAGYKAEWERCLELIASAPEWWPVYPVRRRSERRVRRYVMRRFPYLVPYVLRGDTVVVLAVAHTSRRPTYWLPRL